MLCCAMLYRCSIHVFCCSHSFIHRRDKWCQMGTKGHPRVPRGTQMAPAGAKWVPRVPEVYQVAPMGARGCHLYCKMRYVFGKG